jgi:two-component system NarL family sensor kinase
LNDLNADIILAIFVATVVLLILSSFGIIFTVIYKKKQHVYQNEKKLLQIRFQEELLKTQLEIKEDTLKYIAYELHDNLGQIASLIKINLNTLTLKDEEKASRKIEDTKDLVRQLIYDLKSLSMSLNSDRVIQVGLVKSLETEVERLNKTGQVEATLAVEGAIPKLSNNVSIIFFRMTQEIINNIVKHSKASQVNILFSATQNLVTFKCHDNGMGFDVAEKIQNGGSGLLNLQNRARFINAQLNIQSSSEGGTTVSIQIPTDG